MNPRVCEWVSVWDVTERHEKYPQCPLIQGVVFAASSLQLINSAGPVLLVQLISDWFQSHCIDSTSQGSPYFYSYSTSAVLRGVGGGRGGEGMRTHVSGEGTDQTYSPLTLHILHTHTHTHAANQLSLHSLRLGKLQINLNIWLINWTKKVEVIDWDGVFVIEYCRSFNGIR